MELKAIKIEENVPLSAYTTFRIGGKADFFLNAEDEKEVASGISWARQNKMPFFILGNGSNLLVSDRGFKGLVIKIKGSKLKVQKQGKFFKITADAGVNLGKLLSVAVKNSLGGFEWSAGIPGTLGGAIYGNAGAFNRSIKNSIISVDVFDAAKNRIMNFRNKDCKFGYRDSIFKNSKNLIILAAVLRFEKKNKEEIKEKIQKNLFYKKEKQPLNFPSAGSVFKNPKDSGFSAGELILKAGLQGKKAGGAEISEKHANFIVNFKRANANDVIRLIKLTRRQVKNKFGIKLEEEIQYLGF